MRPEAETREIAPPRGPSPSAGELWALGAILAVAMGLRAWVLRDLALHDPFFDSPSVDEQMYHEWAASIARGEGLGGQVFLNGPAYPVFLAAIYRIFGPSVLAAKAVQSALGVLDCVLVWALGRRLLTPMIGLGGAAILAVYEQALFYPATLLLEGALNTLLLGMLWLCVRAQESGRPARWAAAGACTGLAALARPTALGFALAMTLWAALRPGVVRRARGISALAYALGVAAAIAPATVYNARVGGDFVLVTYAGGMNLYIGNNPASHGEFDVPPIVPTALADDPEEQRAVFAELAERARGRSLAPSEVSQYWAGRALEFVREQPLAWLRLMARKVVLSLNAYEPWNVRSLTLAREASAALRLPLLGFGAIAPFAALGLWATRRARVRLVPLYAWLATVWLTLWVFFVLSRYRVAAVPVLAVFAAAGVASALEALRRRRAREIAAVTLALAALALAVNRPIERENLGIAWYNLANHYRDRGEYDRAIELYQRALVGVPGYLSAYNNLARTFEDAGRRDEAVTAWGVLLVLAQRQGSPQHVERAQRHLAALGASAEGARSEASPPARSEAKPSEDQKSDRVR
ncbi:MAG TPA: glycosyltransferase family 39 protein [Myxococcota bacterium]|nr:glycosyltransferase family 39 protein [Myxococcota bacterium]